MNIDLLVVGSGGNGQTYFMKYIMKYSNFKLNCDRGKDGLKHLSSPKKIDHIKYNINKIIFIYNEPLKAINSLYNRGWLLHQINKLGNPHKLNKNIIKNMRHYLENCNKSNIDISGIKLQFDNWCNEKLNIPIYFLNFNNINNIDEQIKLCNFLNTNTDFFNNIKIKKRSEFHRTINEFPNVIKMYNNIYKYIKINAENKNNTTL